MRERYARLLAALTGALVVLLSAGFAWVQNLPDAAAAPPAGTPLAASASADPVEPGRQALGRRIYDEQGCARCHAIAGEGSPRSPLDGVGGLLDATELRHYITGDPAVADNLSPRVISAKRPFADLPAEQLDTLVEYLQTLR